jgi:hypothetical protein
LKVVRNEKKEAKYLADIKAWLGKRPRSKEGWHVSDLLYPRKTFWRHLKPLPLTDEEALYFVAGHGHHHVLEAILGPKVAAKDGKGRTDAGEFEKHGILFSPDMRSPHPIEIKTSRAKYIKADREAPKAVYEGYLKQLGSYQGLMGSKAGELLVLFLNAVKDGAEKWKTKPQLRLYDVTIDPDERKKIVGWILKRAKMLTAAIKKKKVAELPLCPTWLCRDCTYFKACKPWLIEPGRKNAQDKK